jgi:G3E family GTPase
VADAVVITKTDVSDEAELGRLEEALAAINPGASRVRAVHGDVDPDRLSALGPLRSGADGVARWVRGDRPSLAGEHHHADDIQSFAVKLPASVDWTSYTRWLAALRRIPGEKLLRVKGILGLGPEATPHVVQGVQHVFSHPAPLDAWPWADHRSRIVFIVQGLPRADIAGTLAGWPFEFVSEPVQQ